MPQPLLVTRPVRAELVRPGRGRRIARRIGLALLVLLVLLAAALAGAALWLRGTMKDSLPQVAGERRIPGLAAPVSVERDALGTPTIHAATRVDAARALGFLHAQERFFQMDLMRRQAAGELSELFGPVAVETDKANRIHRFRDEARRVVAGLSPEDRAMLAAYAGGVEAGRLALAGKPFEYALLRVGPAPWRSEDTILTVFAMFTILEEVGGHREGSRGVLHDVLPPAMAGFLDPAGTSWDAPLAGDPVPQPPIPGPEVFDLRTPQWAPPAAGKTAAAEAAAGTEPEPIGSNNWAVAGTHTADGHALLANDMHLGLSVPNTWYRASIRLPDRRVTGVTLPGTPLVAAGSTGRIAWGFTDSYIDWHDVVLLETDPKDSEVYRTPEGPKRIQHFSERIRVKGGKDRVVNVPWTIWGPVTGKDHRGRTEVLSWMAHRPDSVNLGLLRLETARTVDEAIEIAHTAGLPPENLAVADADGRIGWTIVGFVPRRVGFDGSVPTSWADGSRRWDGWLPSAEVPKIVDPPSGRIWTANNKVVSGADFAKLGDGGVWQGSRARQIRDDLLALDKATPKDLLAIQLDDRAVFLERWRGVLLAALTGEAVQGHPRRGALKHVLETSWTGRAAADSAAYRAVRSFHDHLRDQVFAALTARCQEADPKFEILELRQLEGPLWELVQKRPAHLLAPRFKSWDEQILAAADAYTDHFTYGSPDPAKHTWGERNTASIRHPLSYGIPVLGRWIDMPRHPLPGDQDTPRVQNPVFGASERLVVSPGHEEAGLFHMPAGESGNPLSPHYRDGHAAWEKGEPTPFLPGKTVEVLRLVP
jgi:penicillin amidase